MNFLDTTSIIQSGGYIALFAFLFAETGLLIGILLPGESLLFTAGLLASSGYLDIGAVIPLAFLAGILGDSLGYSLGYRFGYDIFARHPKLGLDNQRIGKIQKFYEDHGGQTLIIARFIPFLRTIVPVLAGIAKMEYKSFLVYNVIGAAAWAVVVSFIGYYLGVLVPDGSRYEPWITSFIMVLCLLPLLAAILERRKRK